MEKREKNDAVCLKLGLSPLKIQFPTKFEYFFKFLVYLTASCPLDTA